MSLAACGRISFDPLATSDAPVVPDARTAPCTAYGPFAAPVKLQGVQTALDDVAAVIPPDGAQLYYSHPSQRGDIDIFVADRTGDFSFANARLSSASTDGDDIAVTTSNDGLTLYFVSTNGGQNGVYAATRATVDDEFTNPQRVFPSLSDAVSFSFSADELTVYATMSNDLYRATRPSTSADFGTLIPIPELNTSDFEFDLFIATDNRAFFDRNAGAAAPSFWTADYAPTTHTFSAVRKWELSQPGVGEHSLRMTHDGTELWLAIHDDANAGNELYVSRRACLN